MAPKKAQSSEKLSNKKVQSRGRLSPCQVKFAVENNEEVMQELEQEVEQEVAKEVAVDLNAMTVLELRRMMEVQGIPFPKAKTK